MRLTVIVDASWCPETRAAAWAAWISGHPTGRRQFSGTFKELELSSETAELHGIINALWYGQRLGGTEILLQCDCLGALRQAIALWNTYPCAETCVVKCRHVKGHTKHQSPRFYVNRWCDKTAKGLMRVRREEIRNG